MISPGPTIPRRAGAAGTVRAANPAPLSPFHHTPLPSSLSMPTPPERNRRITLLAAALTLIVLVVILASLFKSCQEGDEGTSEQIAPAEGAGPAPGVE